MKYFFKNETRFQCIFEGQIELQTQKSICNCKRFDELNLFFSVKAFESYHEYLGRKVFRRKLKGRREMSLPRACREFLVKAVAQSISAYLMSCFALSNGLCNQIEQTINKFY